MTRSREPELDETIRAYRESVQALSSEPAKSHRFSILLNDLFGLQPGFIEDYVAGIERYVKIKQKDQILRGRVDNLFGNLVIEFERNLAASQLDAEEQLKKYLACVWSQEPPHRRTPYLCIAGDGVNFLVYSPTIQDTEKKEVQPEEVRLELIEQVDWSVLKPQEVYFWLDRYFLRKKIRLPKTEEIVKDFGVKSHAFQVATQTLLSLWRRVESQSGFTVAYESWEKYLRIVYGTSVAEEELFIRHTYLATLAKLMAWSRLTEGTTSFDNAKILPVLEGQFFKEQGIENFLEEDFFSWIVRDDAKDEGVELARMLLSLLRNYNLRELSEDVLKSLYQELVDPKTRHDLGEYYTPDWLAHRMVRRLIERQPKGSFLDPACGSGTFLYFAIREKRERLGDSQGTLGHILDGVYGVDVHPLAVNVAKTNYVLALGDLLKKRRGTITIPVYLADSIKLPERFLQGPQYEITLESQAVYVHEALLEKPGIYDQAIELAKDFAIQNKRKPISQEAFRNFLIAQNFPAIHNSDLIQSLFTLTETLKELLDKDRDTIWAFVLKNNYKPLFLKRKFDFVVGNPPWIVLKSLEPGYQAFLKQQITKEYFLLPGRVELLPNLEIATLFLSRAADLYLKPGGYIAFLLPKSIFNAEQHNGLRRGIFKFSEDVTYNLVFREVWDCEGVEPLFNVPASVLVAEKAQRGKVEYPIHGQILDGKLERKNASLAEAESSLRIEDVAFSLHVRGTRSFWGTGEQIGRRTASPYKKKFTRGMNAITPRSFWFVQVKPSPLGFNPDLPPLETSEKIKKGPVKTYLDVKIQGNIESRFLFTTLLGGDFLPFGYRDLSLVVLPIEPEGEHYQVIDAREAHRRGFLYLAAWLEKVELEWIKRRGLKANRMSIYEYLDLFNGLSRQNPRGKYRVLYPTATTYICACVIEQQPFKISIHGQVISTNGFIADTGTYYFETYNEDEAYYLAATLNSRLVDRLIKPLQTPGLFGVRNIHKKVLELPIPQFDPSKKGHLQLAELGKTCSEKVAQWLASGGPGKTRSIGRLRAMVREMLQEELKEIDELTRQVLESDV